MSESVATNAWSPILQGVPAEQARSAIKDIARSLQEASISNLSLADGLAGVALFYAYLAQAEHNDTHAATAMELLAQTVDEVATRPLPHSLYTGLAGVAWTLSHLQGRLFDAEADAVDVLIDETLLADVCQTPWTHDYDLMSGLVGIGVYMAERLPHPLAVAGLEQIVERLAERAIHHPDGVTWWTDPAWLSPDGRAQLPQGCYDLGMAHGVAGVIALLSQVCALGCAEAKARPLLDGAVAWLLAQQLQREGRSRFPTWVQPDGTRPASRLAWCYGDLSLSLALLRAGRFVNEPAWEQTARQLARNTAQRAQAQEDVRDTGLCHGFAGIGHLFNRLYQASREAELAELARLWFARTLAQRQSGHGIAGFLALGPESSNTLQWVADPGLLTGAAGIGLALLAAIHPLPPDWDQVMLVAVPAV
jgi:lantibiotic modifying enzyme